MGCSPWGCKESDRAERLTLSLSGTSLLVQWLRLHASNAGDVDLFTGQGTKIPHVVQQK